MLTLDGTTMPNFNNGNSSGAGLGIGGGVLGGLLAGGVGGALAGGLLGNRNGGGWGGNGWNGAAAPATTAVATDIVLNPAFQSVQNQVSNLASQVAAGDLNNILQSEFRRLNQAIDYNANQFQSSLGDIATAQAAANFTTLSSINGLGRDVQTQVNATNVNMLQNFNQLGLQNVNGFNNQAIQSQNLATQIINQGVASAAAMAECCCAIKGLILSDGNMTRALINTNTIQDLRDRNTDLAGQVSNNTQNQYLLNTILSHLSPAAVVSAVV